MFGTCKVPGNVGASLLIKNYLRGASIMKFKRGFYKMKQLFTIAAVGLGLTSCSGINQTMQSLEENRAAIDYSTQVVYENVQAIQEANRAVQENRRELEQINQQLRQATEAMNGNRR
jgi:methyl-accepting chemotaxis protein